MRRVLFCFLLIIIANLGYGYEVKILIVEKQPAVYIEVSSAYQIKDLSSGKTHKQKAGNFKVSKSGKKINIDSLVFAGKAEIILTAPAADAYFTINGNKYNGQLTIIPEGKTVNIVETTSLEHYLYGVLPYEMSASWPQEALKAQAVAARTYTLKTLENHTAGHSFDLYADVRSQMYKGGVKVYDSVKQAVDKTKGQVLKYKNELFYTYYHANCGGHTDRPLTPQGDIKPLAGAVCGYCGESKSANWQYALPKKDADQFLKMHKIPGSIKSIKVADKFASGRAKTLLLTTTKTKKVVECNTFRIGVGSSKLKSCFITKINGFDITGKGYGHGWGMCQDGAKGMALTGKKYRAILNRYYPSAEIAKI